MFSFSGLTKEQVAFLREEKAIYIVDSGRINVAGLTPGNLGYVCDAVAEAMNR
jgi:aspartate/tyrosine/aromatic aminotransferase